MRKCCVRHTASDKRGSACRIASASKPTGQQFHSRAEPSNIRSDKIPQSLPKEVQNSCFHLMPNAKTRNNESNETNFHRFIYSFTLLRSSKRPGTGRSESLHPGQHKLLSGILRHAFRLFSDRARNVILYGLCNPLQAISVHRGNSGYIAR